MAGIAHGWHPTQEKGPPESVAKEFNQADKGTKMLSSAMKGKKHSTAAMSKAMRGK